MFFAQLGTHHNFAIHSPKYLVVVVIPVTFSLEESHLQADLRCRSLLNQLHQMLKNINAFLANFDLNQDLNRLKSRLSQTFFWKKKTAACFKRDRQNGSYKLIDWPAGAELILKSKGWRLLHVDQPRERRLGSTIPCQSRRRLVIFKHVQHLPTRKGSASSNNLCESFQQPILEKKSYEFSASIWNWVFKVLYQIDSNLILQSTSCVPNICHAAGTRAAHGCRPREVARWTSKQL